MRVLVTGGAGYVGSTAALRLLDRGHEVVVLDNFDRGHRQAIDRRAELVECDLRDAEATRAAVVASGCRAVMHFAAHALVGESMSDPLLYYRNNLVGGINLLAAMEAAGARRIVFSSTCAVYGQPEEHPISEASPHRPENVYGESKESFERILFWLERLGRLEPIALRYFNAAGACGALGEDHEPETHLIPLILRVALGQSDRILVFGDDYDTPDGTCIRDYVHIEDLAEAHIQALESAVTGAFNLGTGAGASVLEVIEAARRVTGHPIPHEVAPRRPGDPARLVAQAERARRELGWRPRHDLDSILRDAWDWHRAHPRGYGGREANDPDA